MNANHSLATLSGELELLASETFELVDYKRPDEELMAANSSCSTSTSCCSCSSSG